MLIEVRCDFVRLERDIRDVSRIGLPLVEASLFLLTETLNVGAELLKPT